MTNRKSGKVEHSELGKGSLFATGLVAGGALAGVVIAMLTVAVSNFDREVPQPEAAAITADSQAPESQAAGVEPPQQSDAAPKIVNPVQDWLDARSFEKWWEARSIERQKTSHPERDEKQQEQAAIDSYNLLGVGCFAFMGLVLFWFSRRDKPEDDANDKS